jgi:hypothetical protein
VSEFSESFHLRSDDQAEGVDLLRRSGLAGWVFPPADGWVTIVVERDFTGEPEPALTAANTGVLLLYVNAEDHGWSLTLWEGSEERSHYEAEWTEDMSVDRARHRPDEVRRMLSAALPAKRLARLEAVIDAPVDDEAWEQWLTDGMPAVRAADALGLPNTTWMSGDYLRHGGDDRAAAAIRVDPA